MGGIGQNLSGNRSITCEKITYALCIELMIQIGT